VSKVGEDFVNMWGLPVVVVVLVNVALDCVSVLRGVFALIVFEKENRQPPNLERTRGEKL
jgi:hypothetical protein